MHKQNYTLLAQARCFVAATVGRTSRFSSLRYDVLCLVGYVYSDEFRLFFTRRVKIARRSYYALHSRNNKYDHSFLHCGATSTVHVWPLKISRIRRTHWR